LQGEHPLAAMSVGTLTNDPPPASTFIAHANTPPAATIAKRVMP
jgi:hypothetical protein